MLHILGMVGKGIGIALLCILILLIVLLFAVLFVPIRYRITGEKEAAGMPEAAARLTWLFRSAACFAEWKGRLHLGLYVLGFPVYDNLKKSGKNKKKDKAEKRRGKRRKKKKAREQAGAPVREGGPEPAHKNRPEPEMPEKRQEPAPDGQPEKESGREPERAQAEDREKGRDDPQKPGPGARISGKIKELAQKIAAFFRMLINLAQKLIEFPRSLCEKAAGLKERAEDLLAFLQREDLRRALSLCKKQLLCIWRNVKPGKIKTDIRFGFADPSVTGQILAAAGMLYPVLGKNMILRPDFEEPVLSGEILIKGKITVFVLLKVLWKLYFDKDIKRLIRIWKKEETLHGRQ